MQAQLWAALPMDVFLQAVGSALEYSGLRALVRSGKSLGAAEWSEIKSVLPEI